MNTYQITIQTDGDLTVATVSRDEQSVTHKFTHWQDQEKAESIFDICAKGIAQVDQARKDFNANVMAYYKNPLSEDNIKRLLGFGRTTEVSAEVVK